jgi:hypothetical protein
MISRVYSCPACQSPIHWKTTVVNTLEIVVWCGNARCWSDVAKGGQVGKTSAEAFAKLTAAVKAESEESK